jgi:hypothetical protein
MSNIYFYKMTVDNNGAPCVDKGKLTLAICKPIIRKYCQAGDLIFGFGSQAMGKSLHLIYVAKIKERIEGKDYYSNLKYTERPDCIYQFANNEYIWRDGKEYHKNGNQIEHDLGKAPEYKKAGVLLSEEYRYYGKESKSIQKLFGSKPYTELLEVIKNLYQGHRIEHSDVVETQLEELKKIVFLQPKPAQENPSTNNDCSTVCNDTEEKEVLCVSDKMQIELKND